MEEAILATDIAVYCKNNDQLKQVMTDGSYDINQSDHRWHDNKYTITIYAHMPVHPSCEQDACESSIDVFQWFVSQCVAMG